MDLFNLSKSLGSAIGKAVIDFFKADCVGILLFTVAEVFDAVVVAFEFIVLEDEAEVNVDRPVGDDVFVFCFIIEIGTSSRVEYISLLMLNDTWWFELADFEDFLFALIFVFLFDCGQFKSSCIV